MRAVSCVCAAGAGERAFETVFFFPFMHSPSRFLSAALGVGEGRGVEGENESTVERVVGERVGEGGAAVRTALLALLWESQVGPAGAPAGGRAAPR